MASLSTTPATTRSCSRTGWGFCGGRVADQAGRLVGLLVLHARPDHLLLANVAVSPDVQNLGIGRLLLGLADRRARELGLTEVRLYTNVAMAENLTYYPRYGYQETHRTTQDGFQRLFFAKPLHPA